MKVSTALDTMLSYFLTEFGTTAPVDLDNLKFTQPNISPWVRLRVIPNGGRQYTYGEEGNRVFERFGLILFQVFIPQYTGTFTGTAICQQIVDIFEGKRISNLRFPNGSYEPTGPSDKWYQFNGRIEWEFDEHK